MRRRDDFAAILVGKSIFLREGLAKILRSAKFRILTSVSCADDLLTNRGPSQRSLFLIVHTGDDFDAAVEQIELLSDRHPRGRIAIVTDHYRFDELVSAFRAGADGYFVDVMACDVFIKSIELVMMGETILPPEFLASVLDSEDDHIGEPVRRDNENSQEVRITAEKTIAPQLSPREKSILRCLIEGDSNKCIARKTDIAEATVKVHIKAILRKIKVNNRTQAAIWARNNGSLEQAANTDSPGASKRRQDSVGVITELQQVDSSVSPSVIDHSANRGRTCLEPRAAAEHHAALAPSSVGPCRSCEDLDRRIHQRRK
jgi:two-component system nitrate/nitrite response regulator NarL